MVGADILTLFVILVGIFSLPSLMMYTCMCNWVLTLYSGEKKKENVMKKKKKRWCRNKLEETRVACGVKPPH